MLKGHGNDVSAYLRESINSVGVVKGTCTLYTAQLEYHTVKFKTDYRYTEKYPDPNVVTWPFKNHKYASVSGEGCNPLWPHSQTSILP